MKLFFDFEMTGLHQNTTPISLGIVSGRGPNFYAEFTDYDTSQLNPWLRENVIANLCLKDKGGLEADTRAQIDIPTQWGSLHGSFEIIGNKIHIMAALHTWLRQFDEVTMVGDVLAYDWMLFCEMFPGADFAERLPTFINYIPLDLATMLYMKGVDPDISREEYAKVMYQRAKKHNALYDAMVIRDCYIALTGGLD